MIVQAGAVDVTTYFHLRLAADGTDATALTITNFDLQYVRSGVAPSVKADATALAATDSVHGDNQAIEVDATDQPGVYRVDWPDAAFAAGVREVILTVKVATAFTESLRVELSPSVNMGQVSGDATAADTLELFAEALDQSTGQLDSGSLASGTITAASIAAAALEAGKFASGAFDAVWSVAARLLTAGTNIVLAKGTGVTGFNDLSAAQVNAEADTALTDYDPPTRTELTSDTDSILSKLLKYVQLTLRKDAAIATDNATEVTAINADGGSGAGGFANTTDAQEALRDNQQTAAAAALTAYDPPTNAEMEARTIVSASYATATALQTVDDEIATIDTVVDRIEVDTQDLQTQIGIAGAGLTDLGGMSTTMKAQVNVEADTALTDYDPPTRTESTSDKNEILARLQGAVLEAGTIGATGNDTTHVHLSVFTYGDDEINNYLLVIYDASADEYHARYIEDWVNVTKLATVATLPFTPELSVDGFFLLPFRQDVTGGAGLDAAGVRAAVGLAAANLDTQLGTIDQNVDDILVDTGTTLQAELDGIQADTEDIQTRLPAALVGGRIDATIDGTGLEAGALALINTEVDTALADIHLDHLLAVTYDPATKPGVADALLNELVESDIGVSRFTANALEQAPTGGSAPTADEIADAVWDEATVGHTTIGTFGEQLKTDVDAILVDTTEIGAAGAGLTEAGGDGDHLTAINLPDQTMNITGNLSGSVGSVTAGVTLAAAAVQAIWDALTSALTTVGSIGKLLVDNINATISSRASQTTADAIETDTNELQTDWANGGRLDLIIDARASQTSVDDLPTNAELTTALGTADDAVLAQVAFVKAKTDSLTFTQAGRVDANVTHINETELIGDGNATPWGPV